MQKGENNNDCTNAASWRSGRSDGQQPNLGNSRIERRGRQQNDENNSANKTTIAGRRTAEGWTNTAGKGTQQRMEQRRQQEEEQRQEEQRQEEARQRDERRRHRRRLRHLSTSSSNEDAPPLPRRGRRESPPPLPPPPQQQQEQQQQPQLQQPDANDLPLPDYQEEPGDFAELAPPTPAPSRPKRDRRAPGRYQPYVLSRDDDPTDSSEDDRRRIRECYDRPHLPGPPGYPARGRDRDDDGEGAAGGAAAV